MVISAGKWRHLHVARIMLWKDKDHTYDILNNVEISGSHMIIQTLVRVVESMFVCISFHSIWIHETTSSKDGAPVHYGIDVSGIECVNCNDSVLSAPAPTKHRRPTVNFVSVWRWKLKPFIKFWQFRPPPSYALSRIRRNASHKHYLWKQAWKKLPCT